MVAALFEGRSHAVALHHALDEVKTGIGLRNFRVVGTGDAGKILRPEGRNDDAAIAAQSSEAPKLRQARGRDICPEGCTHDRGSCLLPPDSGDQLVGPLIGGRERPAATHTFPSGPAPTLTSNSALAGN